MFLTIKAGLWRTSVQRGLGCEEVFLLFVFLGRILPWKNRTITLYPSSVTNELSVSVSSSIKLGNLVKHFLSHLLGDIFCLLFCFSYVSKPLKVNNKFTDNITMIKI